MSCYNQIKYLTRVTNKNGSTMCNLVLPFRDPSCNVNVIGKCFHRQQHYKKDPMLHNLHIHFMHPTDNNVNS